MVLFFGWYGYFCKIFFFIPYVAIILLLEKEF